MTLFPGGVVDHPGSRAGQGILALLVWLTIAAKAPAPAWLAPLLPLPALVVVANALGPRPWLARIHWTLSRPSRWTIVLAALLLGAVELAMGLSASQPQVDQPLTMVCAGRSLLQGHDPYLVFEPQCAAELGYRPPNLTAVATGPFARLGHVPSPQQIAALERRDQRSGGHAGFPPFGYPPDATLLALPVAFAGWTVIWFWLMGLCLVLLAAIWGRGRTAGWAALLAWQVLALGALAFTFNLGWDPEYVSYLLLALAFARIDRLRLSSLSLAGALCTNQLCWIAAPIYLAIVLREPEAWRRLGWVTGGVAAGVLPWWAWDHALPQELLRFLTLPYFPGGDSLGALGTAPVGHTWPYLLGILAWIAGCAIVAWRWPQWRWAMVALVWGSVILSDRALDYYFLPIFWLSPAALLGAGRLARARERGGAPLQLDPAAP